MQKRFLGRYIAKATKAEMMNDMWFKLLNEIREKAVDVDPECAQRMHELCDAINEVPEEIRRYVLQKY